MSKQAKAEPERCGSCGDPLEGHRPDRKGCRYNGWANYETWCVKLWLDNDQGQYDYWQERAREVWDEAEPGTYEWQTKDEQARGTLADMLKDEHEEASPAGVTGVYADMLSAAFSEVDWHEIAAALLEDVEEA